MLKPDLSIIVPIYNEKEGLDETIRELVRLLDADNNFECILVNDGSDDGTEQILNQLQKDRFSVLNHARNQGYGRAIKTGIEASSSDYIAITDADTTYPVHRLPEMLNITLERRLDMLVGARTGPKIYIPLLRRPAKWMLTKLANYLTMQEIPDINSGLRIMKKDVVEQFTNILPDGFSLSTTITLAMLTNKFQVDYLPINYAKRDGKSKIRPLRDTLNFIKLILRTILYFDPLRIFVPASLIFFLGACLTFAYRVISGGGFMVTTVLLFVLAVQLLSVGLLADLIVKRLLTAPK